MRKDVTGPGDAEGAELLKREAGSQGCRGADLGRLEDTGKSVSSCSVMVLIVQDCDGVK